MRFKSLLRRCSHISCGPQDDLFYGFGWIMYHASRLNRKMLRRLLMGILNGIQHDFFSFRHSLQIIVSGRKYRDLAWGYPLTG